MEATVRTASLVGIIWSVLAGIFLFASELSGLVLGRPLAPTNESLFWLALGLVVLSFGFLGSMAAERDNLGRPDFRFFSLAVLVSGFWLALEIRSLPVAKGWGQLVLALVLFALAWILAIRAAEKKPDPRSNFPWPYLVIVVGIVYLATVQIGSLQLTGAAKMLIFGVAIFLILVVASLYPFQNAEDAED